MKHTEIDTGCKQIFQHYKFENQKRKLWEEMGELIEALTVAQYTTRNHAFEHVVEEIADVMVVVRQFQLHYAISDDHIAAQMEAKIKRTIEKMSNL
jgi:NTP pyrophosphatase (non-canonical NTP hydrolase)